ncbi:aldehyde dehydrogenase family protein [Mycobacterium sp. CBMA293]|nr:aldehyde dehydrogenase family protein [Mycolicibacterium sp. CBMA 360]MUL62721.1 aldehyde dehydrogenase family protein [Mycolicibacterium sp. CBMA 335]MUL70731.1 aldehyde dehydrogenase family protein [Mycolicibacterium sp. CBMA 311]MUL97245.1 aldehyde dehydrogenase family protein [Mycolicibacterium sp. CBMA 230]MUM15202.1 aldehyde dehydrogenase family protein [Mycolicibacterium sp. CBMA 293]
MTVDVAKQADRVRNMLRHPGNLLIGGEWVVPQSATSLVTSDPGSGIPLIDFPLGDVADIGAAVAAARDALPVWRATPPLQRAAALWRLADLIEASIEDFALLETLDTGKPLDHSLNYDMPSAINNFRYMSGMASRLTGTQPPLATHPAGLFHSYIRLEPIGVVGAIIPWNFPLAGAAAKIAPALACGNTLVVKPSEQTPLTMLRFGELLEEAGIPPGVVNIVTGDGSTGAALTRHPGVNKITFTGSTATGQAIAKIAADNMTRVSLELGGKSPNVIFADADIDAAIAGAAAAIYWDSGEVCSAGSRLYVERTVLDRVLEGLRKTVDAMPIGHGLEANTAIGPLISHDHLQKVAGYVDHGRSEGIEVAFGGEVVDRAGHFYRPTALLGAAPDSAILTEEIFGPVVGVVPFDDTDQVINASNDSAYGLAAGVWTRDIAKAHYFADRVEAGVVWVNTYGIVDPAMPWGGFKKSGWGRENSEQVIHEYTEPKGVVVFTGTA